MRRKNRSNPSYFDGMKVPAANWSDRPPYDPTKPLSFHNRPERGTPECDAFIASGDLPWKPGTPDYEEAMRSVHVFAEKARADLRRKQRGSELWAMAKMTWASIWRMGMYSEDPYIARIAMVHTAQEQIGVQREIQARQAAEQRAYDERARAEAEARDEARMRQMARIMAEEMVDAVKRSNGSPPPAEPR